MAFGAERACSEARLCGNDEKQRVKGKGRTNGKSGGR